jgi:hypothetical protein
MYENFMFAMKDVLGKKTEGQNDNTDTSTTSALLSLPDPFPLTVVSTTMFLQFIFRTGRYSVSSIQV